ncbi:TRAP-type C4-dicarboxylate transport system, substrate-binding protein [Roseovarius marisflavi]|uniref:TRAP-type C4-dicarboxylate transport system, substrate-binding protein n=1 Tax=Roseovarius marisflavi TaxID=1054996 RepID=A0A1M7CD20_9RHOB|nr:TRAP transporter substrate-binding protein DctP [Roseovarius marisflavi]SHL65155.1 TRAP-type C4-dicarboxylate transport system, substrate-binding protein [Roseovarius marisflavi]
MKHFMLGTATAALLALGSIASAADLKMSHVRPQDATIDVELRAFAEKVDAATGGGVKITLFPASALGDYTSVQERISVGAIDMATQPAATAADRKMQISSFPYLAANWAQAREIYGPGGVVRDVMADLYAKQDITMLAAYPVYFGGIALNTDAVHPGDPSPNGIKVRVPGIKSFQLTGEALGYIPSPIPFSEAFTAIQTGVVDGVIGSGAEGYYASFRDVTKTYIPANTHFEVWYMIISNESLAELDADNQAALKAEAEAFEATRWTVAEADQGKNEQRLADDLGTTVVELSDDQLAAMAAKVRADVWPVVLEDVGVEWGQGILDQIGK